MDAIFEWKINDVASSLVDVILECKKDLTKSCFAKYGTARLVGFDVYASSKTSKFIMLDERHTTPSDTLKTDWSKCVAQFEQFRLHQFKNIDDKSVRILALFDADERFPTLWYGNVLLT